jgi:hypothetical protein
VRREERQEVERVLREAWGVDCPETTLRSVSNAMVRLLRTGAGEEPLLLRLREVETETLGREARPDEALIPIARDLLRIGVRPRGSCRLRAPEGGERCTLCEREVPFCWRCPCGFRICQDCLEADRWGYTCNNITWECPECGGFRAF